MREERARLLETPRRDLAAARRDLATWERLVCLPERAEDRHVVDRNGRARFGVLRAAQYDRRREDLPLLRFLLEQEIARYRDIVPWGIGSTLLLAGLLVAEHRQVEDVWLHWQAKSISFDTFLGYRNFYLLTAGVNATVAAVRGSEHPDRDRILHEIVDARTGDGLARFTDTTVDEWLVAQRDRFPDDPDAENLRIWANDAARLGDPDASRRLILAWLDTQPRTEQTLNIVQFHLAELGFLDEAIRHQTEAVSITGPGWGRASRVLGLVRLYRQAGRFADAWQTLRECGAAMPNDESWKQAGLGRYFVKEHFLLVPLAPDIAAAQQLLDEGDRKMADTARLWMDGVLDAAIAAAEHAGQHERRGRYLQLRVDQQRARDEETRRPGATNDRATSEAPLPRSIVDSSGTSTNIGEKPAS